MRMNHKTILFITMLCLSSVLATHWQTSEDASKGLEAVMCEPEQDTTLERHGGVFAIEIDVPVRRLGPESPSILYKDALEAKNALQGRWGQRTASAYNCLERGTGGV